MLRWWSILVIATFVRRIMKRPSSFIVRWKVKGVIMWIKNSLDRSIIIWAVAMRIKNSISTPSSALMKPSKYMPNILNLIAVISWKILGPFISEVECTPMQKLTFNSLSMRGKPSRLKIKKLYCQRITSLVCVKSILTSLNKQRIICCLPSIFPKRVTSWMTKSSKNLLKHMSFRKGSVRLFYITKSSLMSMRENNFHRAKSMKKWQKFTKSKRISTIMTDLWSLRWVNTVSSTMKENFQNLPVWKVDKRVK